MKYIIVLLVIGGVVIYLLARAKNLSVWEYLSELAREFKIIPGVKPGELESRAVPSWEDILKKEVERLIKDLPYR